MKRIIYLNIFLAVISCKSNCDVNNQFKNEFEKSLNFLIKTESDTSFLYQTSDKRNAVFFLEEVTGIESNINKSQVFIYETKEQLENDISNWRDWYDKNKCKYNDKNFDSIKAEINKKL
jgi:hypothetical protein